MYNDSTFFRVQIESSNNDWETIGGKRKCPVVLGALMNDKLFVKQEAKLDDAVLYS